MIEQALGLLVWMVCLALGIIAISIAVLFAAAILSTIRQHKAPKHPVHPLHPAGGHLYAVLKDKD